MTSQSLYKSNSPIRNLQRNSPTRLDTIVQQGIVSEMKSRNYIYANESLFSQNKYLQQQIQKYNSENNSVIMQNSRLRRDNTILNKLTQDVEFSFIQEAKEKEAEINALRQELSLARDQYQREIQVLRSDNDRLQKNNRALELRIIEEAAVLNDKFAKIVCEGENAIKETCTADLSKIVDTLQITRLLLQEKEQQISHLSMVNKASSTDYAINLQSLISENNTLRNKLIQSQMNKGREIKEIQNKKELQKSRTKGIISFCKQNNMFVEKQLNSLSQQLLEKNLNIETLTRQVLKEKKKIDATEKRHEQIVGRMSQNHSDQIKEKDLIISAMEKRFKEQMSEQKKREINLLEQVSRKDHQLDIKVRQSNYQKDEISQKSKEIIALKVSAQQIQDDHMRQISKVMSESKVRRRSMKNISSMSSFKDIQDVQGSIMIKSSTMARENSVSNEGSSRLPTVREELANSINQEEDIEIKQLILHYESMLEEVKKNKSLQMDMANDKFETLKEKLNAKQQELLDVLNRFSPLMELKLNPQSIDEQRRIQIQQHYKSDLSILSVMLQKYAIIALQKK